MRLSPKNNYMARLSAKGARVLRTSQVGHCRFPVPPNKGHKTCFLPPRGTGISPLGSGTRPVCGCIALRGRRGSWPLPKFPHQWPAWDQRITGWGPGPLPRPPGGLRLPPSSPRRRVSELRRRVSELRRRVSELRRSSFAAPGAASGSTPWVPSSGPMPSRLLLSCRC